MLVKFWWDIEGCIDASPKELKFSFSIDIIEMITPLYCQDADTMGNALETAIDIGLGSNSISTVTAIGTATLDIDTDTGNTICGGSIGSSYLGDYDGTHPAGYYSSSPDAITINVEVSTKSADCTDSACLSALYASIIAGFTAFVDKGDLTLEIQTWAATREPPIPELWNAAVVTGSIVTGTFTNPFEDPNGLISATSVVTTSTLSVSGIPTPMTSTEQKALMAYFKTSITDTLKEQGVLPDGAIITIIGITNGVVRYEISLSADTSTEAEAAISQINTSLSQASTLSAIKSAVQNQSAGGSLLLTSLTVDGNTAGASIEMTVAKSTSAGSLNTNVVIAGLSSADVADIETYFEDAISKTLQAEGVLPEGSYVTVTGIDANGIVNYIITMYNDPSADTGSIVSSIESTISSSLAAIKDSVKTYSAGSPVELALSSLSISGFTAGDRTGKKFYVFRVSTAFVVQVDSLTTFWSLPPTEKVFLTDFGK